MVIDPELVNVVAARFKVLGEPARLLILNVLQEGERSVSELVERTGRSQPNVSQHLGHLSRAGLVASRRDGSRVLYRVADPFVTRLCQAVCESLESKLEGEQELIRKLRAGGRRGRGR